MLWMPRKRRGNMEIHEMYQKINNKDNPCKDFVEFVDFMFRNKDCIHKLEYEMP